VHVESVVNKKSRLGVLVNEELEHVSGGFGFSDRGGVLVFLWKISCREPSFLRLKIVAQAANASVAVAVCFRLALESAVHGAYPIVINVKAQRMGRITLEVGIGDRRCSNVAQAIIIPFDIGERDRD